MSRGSLRVRLIAGGLIAIVLALALAGVTLTVLFKRHVVRTIGEELDVHVAQLLAGLEIDPVQGLVVMRPPVDPRFAAPLSGVYWQVNGDDGTLLRSTSLWDVSLALPADALRPGEAHQHEIDGPAGARLLALERQVKFRSGDRDLAVRAVVATDLARVSRTVTAFSRDLMVALGLLTLVLGIATTVQVGLGLQPLSSVRRHVAEVRRGERGQIATSAPIEVQSLVDELNGLIAVQEREIERSRGRAADLAHGLKTPLAALAGDVARLRAIGQPALADDIEQVGDAMSRHVDRELARARAQGSVVRRRVAPTELSALVTSLTGTLMRARGDDTIAVEIAIPAEARVAMDRTDLAEVLGNLLENAMRHARGRVKISSGDGGEVRRVMIEDDGDGIPQDVRAAVMERGRRLDTRGDGAGLGLAIVQDVLETYGWQLDLDSSELGGLKAVISRVARPA